MSVEVAICALFAAPAFATEIGPGPDGVTTTVAGYRVGVHVAPNSSRRWNDVELRLSRSGTTIRKASVSMRVEMPAMSMGAPRFRLREPRPGVYRYSGPAISMPGLWILTFSVQPVHARAFTVVVRDDVRG
jgi:YtkA-like